MDPIADQFAFVSVYNYAENEPVRFIDLWGLQSADNPQFSAVEVERFQAEAREDLFNIAVAFTINYTGHRVSNAKQLNKLNKIFGGSGRATPAYPHLGTPRMRTKIDMLDKSIYTSGMASELAKSREDRAAATSIGQGVSFINPLIGANVYALLLDATREDGLTNLSNGRLATTYENSIRSSKSHPHIANSNINAPGENIEYEIRPYASIMVREYHRGLEMHLWKRRKYPEGTSMYDQCKHPTKHVQDKSNFPGISSANFVNLVSAMTSSTRFSQR